MPRWISYTLFTMILWGGWGVVSKPLANAFSAWQIQTLSTLGILPVLAVLAFQPGLARGPRSWRGFWIAFASGAVTSLGNVACYQALAMGGKAAAVIPLTALYPLVTIVLALLLLGERLSPAQMTGIGIALVALYFFNVGSETGFLTPWLFVALVPIALWGTSAFLQKLATLHASPTLATLAFLVGFVPVALVIPFLTPVSWQLSALNWFWLFLLGLCFALGNFTLILAYGSGGHAAVVTPMASLYSIVTIPLAVLLLGEHIGAREGMGIGLALVAVVALTLERRASHQTHESPTRPESPP
jgi:drug/metabolite transporter (DMT)-like permease